MNYSELVEFIKQARLTADDTVAVKSKELYPSWAVGIAVKTGERYVCDGILWKCLKDHATQDNWKPSIHTASLWTAVSDGSQSGTIDNPIVLPDVLTSYEYEWGKYYLEGSTKYRCNRVGGKVGDKYTLSHKPSQLVGHYFEVAQ